MTQLFHKKDLEQFSFLVTGGAGFIGSHIAEYLLQNGAKKVRVLDNLSNGFQSNIDILKTYTAFEFIQGDIRDAATCQKACAGIDYVSHQAALGSVPRSIKEPVYFNEVNINGFVNMLKAALDNGVKQLVYASSSSVYGDDPGSPKEEDRLGNVLSPYAASKRSIELYAKAFSNVYPFRFIAMRYFNVFGPRQNAQGAYAAVIPQFITALMEGRQATIFGDGEQTRDFTYIANVLQMNILAMSTQNKDAFNRYYNVACGETTSLNRVYEILASCAGSDLKALHTDPRAGDIKDSLANIELVSKHIGYIPSIKIEEGLKKTYNWFKAASDKEISLKMTK